ncbi:ATP-binding protein [Gilliamella sp. M0364]|uniref:ATP-binding protein n=1 Tax=Gilliamella sp. M0364 TaxID=2751011 RepID=UPI0018DC22E6|nr:ATP-binding protein [Gilliamella sp. M0364]MBI0155580.1 ATP-binding protein [Gilliamella sp. M0364]
MKKNKNILNFTEQEKIGFVSAVDTTKVLITVEDKTLMPSISVGHLIAIQGSIVTDFLIGIVDKVTRTLDKKLLTDDITNDGYIPLQETQDDLIRIILIGTYRSVDGNEINTFKRGADSFPQVERACYLVEGNNLQLFMNLLSSKVPENERLIIGKFVADREAIAIANGDKFFQRHAAILGSTGSGKSWTVALILEKAAKLTYSNLIVFDMHGEYSPLCDGNNAFAKRFRIAGPADLDKPSDDSIFLPYWLLNRDEMLAMILDRSDDNAPNQATRFTEHVRKLKTQTLSNLNKHDVLNTFTVDSPIFYNINELASLLSSDNEEKVPSSSSNDKKKNGPWNGKLTRFVARLNAKIEDRRLGFMFNPPEKTNDYNWLVNFAKDLFETGKNRKGIKVIDFSEVPSDVLPIVTGVLARLIYTIQFWIENEYRHPLTLVCDEAHLYLPVRNAAEAAEKRSLESFERIAKEGRKYGVSLLVISQRPSDVSRTILSQCNNFIVLRLTNDQDQNVVKRLIPESMGGIADILPLLDTGEALILGDSILLPTRIKLDKPFIEPASATKQFWTEWANNENNLDSIADAVSALRKQSR